MCVYIYIYVFIDKYTCAYCTCFFIHCRFTSVDRRPAPPNGSGSAPVRKALVLTARLLRDIGPSLQLLGPIAWHRDRLGSDPEQVVKCGPWIAWVRWITWDRGWSRLVRLCQLWFHSFGLQDRKTVIDGQRADSGIRWTPVIICCYQ